MAERDPEPRGAPIGLIGVGLLGLAIAKRLRQHGLPVLGYDRDDSRLALLGQANGQIAPSAAHVAATASRIWICLPDSRVTAEVLKPLRSVFQPGTVVIDATTGTPEDSVRAADDLRRVAVEYLDATVAGSSQQVADGTAVLLVGGSPQVVPQQLALLEAVGARVFYLGESGSGARMKLVVNLAIGLHRAVLAESLALARALGFELPIALDVLKATPAYSRAMDSKGEKMIQADFAPKPAWRST